MFYFCLCFYAYIPIPYIDPQSKPCKAAMSMLWNVGRLGYNEGVLNCPFVGIEGFVWWPAVNDEAGIVPLAVTFATPADDKWGVRCWDCEVIGWAPDEWETEAGTTGAGTKLEGWFDWGAAITLFGIGYGEYLWKNIKFLRKYVKVGAL